MTMDVIACVSSAPVFDALSQTIEAIIEMAAAAKDVLVEKESFLSVATYLERIVPILNALIQSKPPGSAALNNAIAILEREVKVTRKLTLECGKRNKVYLLMNCLKIKKRLEATTKEISEALSLIPVASLQLSTNIAEDIENLSDAMQAAEFRASVVEEQILERIETGIQERILDRSYANNLMSLIAGAVGIPSEQSALRKEFEEFKSEMEMIQLRKDQAEAIQMDQIIALLGRADATTTPEEKQEKYLTKRISLGTQLVEPLEAFYCPISGDVMVDPVETSSGHTFERSKIEKWFAEGKDSCPLTMIPLDTSVLRPNKNLRLAIEEWKDRNTIITVCLLKPKITSEVDQEVLNCLRQLQEISEENAAHCEKLILENYLPLLIDLLRAKNRDITKGALRILQILAKNNDEVKETIATTDNAMILIARSLARGMEERKLALYLLLELSKNEKILDCIGMVHGCILLLVTMSSSADSQEAIGAQELLEHLSISDHYTLQMAKANYFKPLLQRLSSGSDDVNLSMAKALGEMELTDHIKLDLVANGALNHLLPLLSHENVKMRGEAIKALLNLSSLPKIGQQMIREGAVSPLLDLLHNCSPSQSWCEDVATYFKNLAIATEFQEADQEPVILLGSDNDIFRLFSLVYLTGPGIQQNMLRAFQALCHSAEAATTKRALMQCSALQVLAQLCEKVDPALRANALKLFSSLVEDFDEGTLLEEQVDQRCIETLLRIINSSDDDQEVASAMSIISNFSDGTQIRDWLLDRDAVSAICSVIKRRNRTNLLIESAVRALCRLIPPSDLEPQTMAAAAGVIPMLVHLLENGTDISKRQAAICLSQFSQNSYKRSRKIPHRRGLLCFTPAAELGCPVHEGICSVETSFCLVEANAVDPLVNLLARPGSPACEASLDALLTLIDGLRLQKGSKVLAEAEAFPYMIKLLSSNSQSLQEKSLDALERIFRLPEYKLMYGSSAQPPLLDITQRGSTRMKSLAAKILAHLNVLHDQSSFF